MTKIASLIILSLITFSSLGASVKTKYSAEPRNPSYVFNAGLCSFADGQSFRCKSEEAKKKMERLLNVAVTDALAEIRLECVWFDILDVEPAAKTRNKRTMIDEDGYTTGDYAEKHFRAKVRYICERPIS